jgi:hypothetical protein
MRDVNNGWLIRYIHANVASFFFIFVYALIYKFINTNNLSFYNLSLFSYIFNLLEFTNTSKWLKEFLNLVNNKNPEKKLKLDNNFLQWFVGFTDAEGTFLIKTKNNSEVHFCFKITLHINDSAVLFLIKNKLGIGIVSLKGHTCHFSVHSLQLIVDVLLPIFDKYPLLTHKQLNYRD